MAVETELNSVRAAQPWSSTPAELPATVAAQNKTGNYTGAATDTTTALVTLSTTTTTPLPTTVDYVVTTTTIDDDDAPTTNTSAAALPAKPTTLPAAAVSTTTALATTTQPITSSSAAETSTSLVETTRAEALTYSYILTFTGVSCKIVDPTCSPRRFSTGGDPTNAAFVLAGSAASLEACSATCSEDDECVGIYIFTADDNVQNCRGLVALGSVEGDVATLDDLSYTKVRDDRRRQARHRHQRDDVAAAVVMPTYTSDFDSNSSADGSGSGSGSDDVCALPTSYVKYACALRNVFHRR